MKIDLINKNKKISLTKTGFEKIFVGHHWGRLVQTMDEQTSNDVYAEFSPCSRWEFFCEYIKRRASREGSTLRYILKGE
jgi:hypothetical protein